MPQKYLLDTCIWRDFFEQRLSKSNRPLGKYASSLFFKILKRKDTILYSDIVILELQIAYEQTQISNLLSFFTYTQTLEKISTNKLDKQLAIQLSKERNLPKADCLLALQAKRCNAILITQDKHFFEHLSDITIPKRPESIL